MSAAKLLSEPTNGAVVHLPGRAFPGVVIQGDTLQALITDLHDVSSEGGTEDGYDLLTDVIERLKRLQAHYEAVLKREGISLPYARANGS